MARRMVTVELEVEMITDDHTQRQAASRVKKLFRPCELAFGFDRIGVYSIKLRKASIIPEEARTDG